MAYIARKLKQSTKMKDYAKLLSYCIKTALERFEQAFTSCKLKQTGNCSSILRHRSFVQEFSQRYADSSQLGDIPLPELRDKILKIDKTLFLTSLTS